MHPGVERVAEWIIARNEGLTHLDPDCDLVDSRLIDSLGLLEFIMLIERLTARPVDIDNLDIDDFRSLADIDRAFFADAA